MHVIERWLCYAAFIGSNDGGGGGGVSIARVDRK